MKLKGKIALITGSARGIGKAIAVKLAEEGAKVLVADVNQGEADKTSEEINSKGLISKAYKLNVTDSKEVESIVSSIINDFGKIDILINNAGITRDNLFIRMKEEEWDQVIAVNLKGVFNCTKEIVKHMLKARYGKIINI